MTHNAPSYFKQMSFEDYSFNSGTTSVSQTLVAAES